MAKKKFYQSLSYKLLGLINETIRFVPRAELAHDWYNRIHGISYKSIYKTLYGLEKDELIKREKRGESVIFKLTAKGKQKLFLGGIIGKLLKEKNRRWDKKWRIIIFDIPEKRKNARNFLRRELLENNFYMLQKSVWITPHKISDKLNELLEELDLNRCVRCIVADYINYERDLLKYFKIHD